MSVTFLDPTLPARLPSRFEVIDARVTTPLEQLTVSLRLDNGKWDVVYQDGIWGIDYRNSSISNNGLDDNTFHIVRAGGWLPDTKLQFRFKEGEAVSSLWETLIDIDLRTFTSATFTGPYDQAYSFAAQGLTWVLSGATDDAPPHISFVNGRGALLSYGKPLQFAGGGAYQWAFGVKLSSVPGWNQARQTAMMVRFDTLTTGGLLAGNSAVMANLWVQGATYDSVANANVMCGVAGLTSTPSCYVMDGNRVNAQAQVSLPNWGVSANIREIVCAATIRPNFQKMGGCVVKPGLTTMPALEDITWVRGGENDHTFPLFDLVAGATVGRAVASDGAVSYYVTEIRILQKDV